MNPARVLITTWKDPRHTDRLIEIIDTTVDEIVASFAKSKADERKIREWYAGLVSRDYLATTALIPRLTHLTFMSIPGRPRMFEVWQVKGEWRTYAHDPADGSWKIVPYSMKEIAAQNSEGETRTRAGHGRGDPSY